MARKLTSSPYWKILPSKEKEKIKKDKLRFEAMKLGYKQEKERQALIKKIK